MTTLALLLALVEPVYLCPTFGPGDEFPVPIFATCPAPVGGLLYPYSHEELDRDATRALREAAAELRELRNVALDHAGETSPLVWVLSGLALGAGLAYLAMHAEAP